MYTFTSVYIRAISAFLHLCVLKQYILISVYYSTGSTPENLYQNKNEKDLRQFPIQSAQILTA